MTAETHADYSYLRTPSDVSRTREAAARAELRDRLDHMRRVADARARVHAFIDAYAAMQTWEPVVINRANGLPLDLGDLRLLLDGEFTPTRDRKLDDDDEDETGLHRKQAMEQLARGDAEAPEDVLRRSRQRALIALAAAGQVPPGEGAHPSPRGWDAV